MDLKKHLSHPQTLPRWQVYVVNSVRLGVVLLFLFSLVTALHPGLRHSVRKAFNKQFRVVLSTASATFADNANFKIIKIKTENGIFIEVYDQSDEHIKPLVDRIHLPDKKDGFIVFAGQATNLAVDDIDGDNIPEIIVPSFDSNLVAHMNVYSYNPETKRFEKMSGAF